MAERAAGAWTRVALAWAEDVLWHFSGTSEGTSTEFQDSVAMCVFAEDAISAARLGRLVDHGAARAALSPERERIWRPRTEDVRVLHNAPDRVALVVAQQDRLALARWLGVTAARQPTALMDLVRHLLTSLLSNVCCVYPTTRRGLLNTRGRHHLHCLTGGPLERAALFDSGALSFFEDGLREQMALGHPPPPAWTTSARDSLEILGAFLDAWLPPAGPVDGAPSDWGWKGLPCRCCGWRRPMKTRGRRRAGRVRSLPRRANGLRAASGPFPGRRRVLSPFGR